MNITDYSDIWNDTLGQTLEISASDAAITNGLSESTAKRYEEAAELTDDQIWEQLKQGQL